MEISIDKSKSMAISSRPLRCKLVLLSLELHCKVTCMLLNELDIILLILYRFPKENFLENLLNMFIHIKLNKKVIMYRDLNVKCQVPEKESI